MKIVLGSLTFAVASAVFFLFFVPRVYVIVPAAVPQNGGVQIAVASLPSIPEASAPTSVLPQSKPSPLLTDLPKQVPLPNPPEVVKGVYLTGWSAGYTPRVNSLIALAKRTEINAMVIDIKDFSGHVSYKTGIPEVVATGAESEIRILQPNALLKKLHDAGIYVIARETVFQDPLLAKAHPEWALKNSSTSKIWTDRKGLAWMDPAAKPVWEYNISIAKDAIARGFDEVQFDYVRFASDGDLGQISYPFWDQKTARHKVIARFFKYLRDNLPSAKISADLFGLSTVDTWDDLGIGQVIEDAYKNFDYVSPMVYPSHFAPGTLGYKNPAKAPYEVINYSMERALARLKNYELGIMNKASSTATSTNEILTQGGPNSPAVHRSKLRPWLQDFNLGAVYDAAMVKKEMQATYDVFLNGTSSDPAKFGGWLLWDPANTYTEAALEKK